MNAVPIPAWNDARVLPPVTGPHPGSMERSPYHVSLVALVERFATSSHRCRLLQGLLAFRKALHEAGICNGFQWIDGSFSEDIESLEWRPPRDIDVVTFLEDHAEVHGKLPGHLLDQQFVKRHFMVDGYWVDSSISMRDLICLSTYWYSLWSHRRSLQWKGFLEIDLDPALDESAGVCLAAAMRRLAQHAGSLNIELCNEGLANV
ncbi:hypothetical protein D9X30_5364 [Cupriavidus sp. U2]|uniref:DUF6932 family protein n=1 Tax=Cupriavidus sp. U2 TaxID=2920269 RepID=UPI001892A288|nr:hypothetical protein [Cupriavidus sp. U2]KAI3589781.1 hypothetical protein D9X30_5364 [Cupriavidus sp. U2]